jgi:aminocarboxymuconate-semialdehyde decarboxylase
MRGDAPFRPVDSRLWDLSTRLASMDAKGIQCQVLSPVPVMLTSWADRTESARWCRLLNEALASLVSHGPSDRFRVMGAVPLPHGDLAAAELEHLVTELGCTAVEIGTVAGECELDDDRLVAFWEAAEALDVAVFVHPTHGAAAIRDGGSSYEFALGMHTDTGLAASALVFGGVLERFPRLRVGLAHGCGSFPWSLPRLVRGASLRSPLDPVLVMRDAAERASRLWADALVFDPHLLGVLLDRFGADQVMLGTDDPFYPEHFGDPIGMLDDAVRAGLCSADTARAIRSRNGERFLAGSRKTVGSGPS